MINKILFLLIILLAIFVRIKWIDHLPPGIYLDEASIGYDAYSFGIRGKDQYGASFPTYLRSYANYQSPLYTYLSILPVRILGLTPLGIRIVSILSGIITTVTTYFLLKLVAGKKNSSLPLFGSLTIAISPWAIFFSRSALEANLALSVFVLSLLLLFYGIYKKQKLFFLSGFILLTITNYAYHSYRIISFATIILLAILFFAKLSLNFKKIFILGTLFFTIILIPQLLLLKSPGSLKRINSLEYTSQNYFEKNSGDLRFFPLGRFIFISKVFLEKYFDYLSPKSLFFDSDPTAVRSIPELGAFYQWMIIPFIIGFVKILKKYKNPTVVFFGLIGLVSIIPAAITRDNLYLLRVLSYLWILSFVISLGCKEIFNLIKNIRLRWLILFSVLFFSLSNLYINYFNILKNERRIEHSGLLNQLFQFTKSQKENYFIVDLTEPLSYGVALYVYQYNPYKFERSLNFDLTKYYSEVPLKTEHEINNLSIRPINWEKDTFDDIFLIGDEKTISKFRESKYSLTLVKKFDTPLDTRSIAVYKTNPKRVNY